MLAVLMNWCIIFLASVISGYGIVRRMSKNSREIVCRLDLIVVVGIMMVNWYAQLFSIFFKVGAGACLTLFLAGVLLTAVYYWRGFIDFRGFGRALKKVLKRQWIIGVVCVLTTALWTGRSPQHYDTYLYHAQAIRWIEEYGVVAGLGNLHNRLAYNSAFMPLQALFSLKWLTGQSYHAMNGFVCCGGLVYALVSNHAIKGERIVLSDWLKLAMVLYIGINREMMSSPSSDTLPMLLVIYICIKWSEFTEADIGQTGVYALLGMAGIWAITVKLSTAACVIFVLYPFIDFIKKIEWKKALLLGLSCGAYVFPWLTRNILLSGYLLYPYAQIDFFDVDWKMPASVLEYDSREIMVWGRELKDVALYNLPFVRWFPIWFSAQSVADQILIVVGLATTIITVILFLCSIKKRGGARQDILYFCVIAGLVAWMFTAPLMRYGQIYLLLPICVVLSRISRGRPFGVAITGILLAPIMVSYLDIWSDIGRNALYCQEDYAWRENVATDWYGMQICLPDGSDQCGYNGFPGTPYAKVLDLIEPRGQQIKDGFRPNLLYRGKRLNNSGQEWQEE